MDVNAPRPDTPDGDAPVTDPVVPDPHAGEALPEHQSGLRPGVDPDIVRPEQDEPGGPLAGLVGAGAAQVADATGDDDAHDALVGMGVEEEGIESGQLLGFVAATLVAVALLAITLIYFIYAPFRAGTDDRVNDVALYPELEQTRVDARAKLDHTALSADSSYTIPIGRAMGLVAADYGAAPTDPELSRAQFNTLQVNRTAGRAVQAMAAAVPDTAASAPAGSVPTAEGSTAGAAAEAAADTPTAE